MAEKSTVQRPGGPGAFSFLAETFGPLRPSRFEILPPPSQEAREKRGWMATGLSKLAKNLNQYGEGEDYRQIFNRPFSIAEAWAGGAISACGKRGWRERGLSVNEVAQESIFSRLTERLQKESDGQGWLYFFRFFRYGPDDKKRTETRSLGPGTKFPGGGLAATAYVHVGRPTFDNLIGAIVLIIIIRNAVGWIFGRPRNNSKRRIKVVSCKIKAIDSSAPGRINCRLGSSGVRVGSTCWHGVGSRRDHVSTKLAQVRCRTDRVHFLSRLLRILVGGLIGVSGMCWTNQVIKCSAAHRKSDAATVVADRLGDVGRRRNELQRVFSQCRGCVKGDQSVELMRFWGPPPVELIRFWRPPSVELMRFWGPGFISFSLS